MNDPIVEGESCDHRRVIPGNETVFNELGHLVSQDLVGYAIELERLAVLFRRLAGSFDRPLPSWRNLHRGRDLGQELRKSTDEILERLKSETLVLSERMARLTGAIEEVESGGS